MLNISSMFYQGSNCYMVSLKYDEKLKISANVILYPLLEAAALVAGY